MLAYTFAVTGEVTPGLQELPPAPWPPGSRCDAGTRPQSMVTITPRCYGALMPSPVGHALGGVLFGWLVDGRSAAPARDVSTPVDPGHHLALAGWRLDTRTIWFLALGPLADLDFLFGLHSRQSHSVGAVLVVLLVVGVWTLGRAPSFAATASRLRFALACASAYGSHVLFDWMGNDTTPPIGIMALWPFSDAFYQSNLFVFEAISRRWWLAGFWTHNLLAAAREVAIVLPLVALVAWWQRRTPAWRVAVQPADGR